MQKMMALPLSDRATRQAVIDEARGWIETPYQHQASLKHIGCDCLGLVRGVWRALYSIEPEPMPAYAPDWAEAGGQEQLFEAAMRHMQPVATDQYRPGDLLAFRWRPHLPAKHLAIATSATTMIHAQQGASVCEVPICRWWHRHLAFCFQFPPLSQEPLQ
jgi:NlpC/P60 family putative phage cell wall peptidase